jgi:hypothetical protein
MVGGELRQIVARLPFMEIWTTTDSHLGDENGEDLKNTRLEISMHKSIFLDDI